MRVLKILLLTLALSAASPLMSQEAVAFEETYDTLELYRINKRVLIDKIEREHVPLDGRKVSMIPFRVDSLFGFVSNDSSRKWLIRPRFTQVYAVYPEGAIVKDNKTKAYGLTDATGKYLIPAEYMNLLKENGVYHGISRGTSQDTALPSIYRSYQRNDYYSLAGKLLFSEKAHDLQSFEHDTLAWFRYGSVVTVRSRSGAVVKRMVSDQHETFIGIGQNLLLTGSRPGGTAVITAHDAAGRKVFEIPRAFQHLAVVYQLSPDFFAYISTNGEYHFCDSSGVSKDYAWFSDWWEMPVSPEYFLPAQFTVLDPISGLQGVTDRQGKFVVEQKYRFIGPLSEGRYFCMDTTRRHLFIDSAGNVLKDVTYLLNRKAVELQMGMQQPVGFSEGLCTSLTYRLLQGDTSGGRPPVYIDEDSTYFFYFDRNFESVLELPTGFLYAGPFSEGLAPVIDAERLIGFINRKGEWVIQPAYEVSMAGAYPLPYPVIPEFKGGFAYIKSWKGYIDNAGKPLFTGIQLKDHYDFSH